MVGRLVTVAVLACAVLASVERAHALGCVCMLDIPTVEAARASADIVVLGVVERDEKHEGSASGKWQRRDEWHRRHVVTLSVRKIWKGARQDTIVINTGDDYMDCGIRFKVGALYLVYGHKTRITWDGKTEEVLADWHCGRRLANGFPEEDFAALGEPTFLRR